jgi:hypothetical protein
VDGAPTLSNGMGLQYGAEHGDRFEVPIDQIGSIMEILPETRI